MSPGEFNAEAHVGILFIVASQHRCGLATQDIHGLATWGSGQAPACLKNGTELSTGIRHGFDRP